MNIQFSWENSTGYTLHCVLVYYDTPSVSKLYKWHGAHTKLCCKACLLLFDSCSL